MLVTFVLIYIYIYMSTSIDYRILCSENEKTKKKGKERKEKGGLLSKFVLFFPSLFGLGKMKLIGWFKIDIEPMRVVSDFHCNLMGMFYFMLG